MTDERALLYANAQAMIVRLAAEAIRPAVDREWLLTIGALASGLLDDLEAGEAEASLGARFPALERWRAQVLEARGRHPLEVAAAWELTALACERDGASELVESALANARQALRNRRVA